MKPQNEQKKIAPTIKKSMMTNKQSSGKSVEMEFWIISLKDKYLYWKMDETFKI